MNFLWRLLIVLAVLIGSVSQAAHVRRRAFRFEGGYLLQVGTSTAWSEEVGGEHVSNLKELTTGPGYVELLDEERQRHIRLYQDRIEALVNGEFRLEKRGQETPLTVFSYREANGRVSRVTLGLRGEWSWTVDDGQANPNDGRTYNEVTATDRGIELKSASGSGYRLIVTETEAYQMIGNRRIEVTSNGTWGGLETLPSAFETELLNEINYRRQLAGVPYLRGDFNLIESCQKHASDMAEAGQTQQVMRGYNAQGRASKAGYQASSLIESYATGFSTIPDAVRHWMENDPEAKKSIETAEFVDMGVGVAINPMNGRTFFCLVIAKP